jgi:hypothetical protein
MEINFGGYFKRFLIVKGLQNNGVNANFNLSNSLKNASIGTLDIKTDGPTMSIYYALTGLRELNIDAELFIYELDDPENKVPIHYAGFAIDNFF